MDDTVPARIEAELKRAEDADDAARVETLDRLHELLESHLDDPVSAPA